MINLSLSSSVNLGDVEVGELGLVLALVDLAPDVAVALHQVLDPVAVAQAVVRVDWLGDMDGVFLDGEASVIQLLGVLHGDEAGEHRDIGLAGKDKRTSLERLGLAVVPPHALLRVDQHEIALLEQRNRGVEELLHGLQVG